MADPLTNSPIRQWSFQLDFVAGNAGDAVDAVHAIWIEVIAGRATNKLIGQPAFQGFVACDACDATSIIFPIREGLSRLLTPPSPCLVVYVILPLRSAFFGSGRARASGTDPENHETISLVETIFRVLSGKDQCRRRRVYRLIHNMTLLPNPKAETCKCAIHDTHAPEIPSKPLERLCSSQCCKKQCFTATTPTPPPPPFRQNMLGPVQR